GLNANFDEIFACQYVKVRFGRMPYDSYEKLSYYNDKTFFFFPFDHNSNFYWGAYFAPSTKIAVIDDVFASLYFERVHVPEYAHGTPEIAINNIESILKNERQELAELNKQLDDIKAQNIDVLMKTFSACKFFDTAFSLRKNVATVNKRFYLIGFVPKCKADDFEKSLADISSVSCVVKPYDADPTLTPPVKLKNNRFTRPFEMFVNMYSLPSYHDIDPTSFMAISYTLLFGIMFGDLGQGLVLSLIGFVLAKWKDMDLGKIMIRLGFSSAFFGLVYGSVFGYENLLNPLYKALFGLEHKPVEVFDNGMTNILLLGAIAIGATLIIISICINIVLGFKVHDYERAVFGHNGIAGLVFYVSILVAAVCTLLLGYNLFVGWYIVLFMVIPLVVIFLRIPLANLVKRKKSQEKQAIGEFIIENFFELFEYVLSYLSNTMSFLRVGGFILSHAGMMAVVLSLSEMAGTAASPIVMIIGNIFVMCLEGLIVGIQVLRLEFYEIFSRNFEGNGKPFEPATVSYDINKD
ncbi:MAG: V-type ATPase 116kDa subunit family protein, partial [Oscillospiraceae bacterium]